MRKIVLIAAPLALVASPALAEDATGTVDITGSVAGRCLFTTPSGLIELGELSLGGSDSNAGRLDDSVVNGESATLVGWCNGSAAGMYVEAFPLLNSAPDATGFTNRVDFTATAEANEAEADDTSTDDGAGDTVSVGMFAGNVVVTLSDASAPSNDRLVAGDYDGSVVVTLTPNFVPEGQQQSE
jgi:hypothetical protein